MNQSLRKYGWLILPTIAIAMVASFLLGQVNPNPYVQADSPQENQAQSLGESVAQNDLALQSDQGAAIPAGEFRPAGTIVVKETVDFSAMTINVEALTLVSETEFGVFGNIHVNGWENYPDINVATQNACKQALSRLMDALTVGSWNEGFSVTLNGVDPTNCTPDAAPLATGVVVLSGSVPAGTLVVVEMVNHTTMTIDVSFRYLATDTTFGSFGDTDVNGWSGYSDMTEALQAACEQAHERLTQEESKDYSVTLLGLGGLVPEVCPVACK